MTNLVSRVLAVVALSAVTGAYAGTNGFVVPSIRQLAGSEFAGWERFTVATNNGVGNLGDIAVSSPAARLIQLSPTAAILSSGNIYNQFEKSEFKISYARVGDIGPVVLQVRTAGTELNYDSVRLEAAGSSLSATRTELDRVDFGVPAGQPGSGAFVSSKWEWDLTGKNAKNFVISFAASDVSVSLDSATLDVGAAGAGVVPEPQTWALLGVGALGLGWMSRRRASR